jgi:hypothetical protein
MPRPARPRTSRTAALPGGTSQGGGGVRARRAEAEPKAEAEAEAEEECRTAVLRAKRSPSRFALLLGPKECHPSESRT